MDDEDRQVAGGHQVGNVCPLRILEYIHRDKNHSSFFCKEENFLNLALKIVCCGEWILDNMECRKRTFRMSH